MKLISSRDNPLFKQLHRLAEDARECRRQGRSLIDGPHLVMAYRDQVGLPEHLLVSESRVDNSEICAAIKAHAGCDILLLKDSLFKLLSGVDSPVGIGAAIRIPPSVPAFQRGTCVLLDAVQDAGNVGSIMRSSAAAGIRDIFLGPGCANAWSPRVLRAAQGAHFRLRIREHWNLDDFLRSYSGTSIATVVSGGAALHEANLSGDIAWLFGNEGQGVNPALLSLTSTTVTIPMASEVESLNVSAAAAICLFATMGRNR